MNTLIKSSLITLSMFVSINVMAESSKPLILYFSQPQTVDKDNNPVKAETIDAHSGASALLKNGELLGSNEYFAKQIQAQTKGDLVRLETEQTYPTEHKALLDFGQDEQRKGTKPALKNRLNLEGYETIFIGYPIWWYKMPMAMQGFFEQYDFSGKKVILFTAHGGSRFSGSSQVIKTLQPNAEIQEGFEANMWDITRANESLEKRLSDWLTSIGYAK